MAAVVRELWRSVVVGEKGNGVAPVCGDVDDQSLPTTESGGE